MKTQRVSRWIGLGHLAGGVSWSPDGRRLLVTTYNTTPDITTPLRSSRTGFLVINPRSGRMTFHTLAPSERDLNARQDLGWSLDGSLIRSPNSTYPKIFYDLDGTAQPAPPHEADNYYAEPSPSRRYFASGWDHNGGKPSVKETATGRKVPIPPVQQFKIWADDSHLIAQACDPKCTNEYHIRLVLISIGSKEITPLTGYQDRDKPGGWEPLFTHR